ncbi:hypothetical protein K7X08_004003 [Anisodus acutangulus]|uniref:Uncharacterized protein n=1 Tax=Anisodus acutangulus TaxID=402998 RepID=A0A9Q1MGQ0_9SOLA|nr:hypothetical protein K7X08_004003 [Anisodus acutangulus]
MQKISSSENVDEDYAEYLKLFYNYDKNSQSYTNEHGNNGSYDEEEDEADPQYKMFLANAKPDGTSYVLNVDAEDGSPLFMKYEKECECNYGCECLCWKKQKDIEMQKDAVDEENLLNIGRSRRFSRSMRDADVIFEPSNPTSQRKNGIMSRNNITVKCGASKRLEMQKDVVDEENLLNIRRNRRFSMTRSMGDVDVTFEPSNPTSQRKNGIMSRKISEGKRGASERQGKCETKIKSGCKPVHVTGKKEASDVDENYGLLLENLQFENRAMKASLRSGCNIEYEAAEDDLEILYDKNDMLKKINVQSEFRQKVMDLLKKPYNANEYKELWTYVNDKKPVERNMESRRGGVKCYKTKKIGKSYLDHYEDLKEKLKEVDNDKRKKLKIMRGFSFWLQVSGSSHPY